MYAGGGGTHGGPTIGAIRLGGMVMGIRARHSSIGINAKIPTGPPLTNGSPSTQIRQISHRRSGQSSRCLVDRLYQARTGGTWGSPPPRLTPGNTPRRTSISSSTSNRAGSRRHPLPPSYPSNTASSRLSTRFRYIGQAHFGQSSRSCHAQRPTFVVTANPLRVSSSNFRSQRSSQARSQQLGSHSQTRAPQTSRYPGAAIRTATPSLDDGKAGKARTTLRHSRSASSPPPLLTPGSRSPPLEARPREKNR